MSAISRLQSTLPHGERLLRAQGVEVGYLASIHAPARGATELAAVVLDSHSASIHAPARGATARHQPAGRGQGRFNPRSRTGSDGPSERVAAIAQRFNPRSRTGSDASPHGLVGFPSSFNPRSRTGSDRSSQLSGLGGGASIHAPARGATGRASGEIPTPCRFNPRSRTGSDASATRP